MKPRLVALRLAVAVLVCYASFFLFTRTSMYVAVTRLASGALPGIQPDVFVFTLLTAVVLVACLFGGKRSAHLIYWMSIFFYLPSVLSVSGLRLEFFSWQVGTSSPQLFSVTAFVGLAIVAGYLWFICTSWFEEAYRVLKPGGALIVYPMHLAREMGRIEKLAAAKGFSLEDRKFQGRILVFRKPRDV